MRVVPSANPSRCQRRRTLVRSSPPIATPSATDHDTLRMKRPSGAMSSMRCARRCAICAISRRSVPPRPTITKRRHRSPATRISSRPPGSVTSTPSWSTGVTASRAHASAQGRGSTPARSPIRRSSRGARSTPRSTSTHCGGSAWRTRRRSSRRSSRGARSTPRSTARGTRWRRCSTGPRSIGSRCGTRGTRSWSWRARTRIQYTRGGGSSLGS